ncbi:hypothetical protein THERMOT_1894 [Bathymodiolus thermophilus thioautotrophic gill symbiont]|nr:hypothetical protein THERMOT_1894 [Bathymodiolus thermophilus thioautotrophic gill symbiont]
MNRFRKPNGMMSTVTRGAKQCDGWDEEHLTHNNSDGWWH